MFFPERYDALWKTQPYFAEMLANESDKLLKYLTVGSFPIASALADAKMQGRKTRIYESCVDKKILVNQQDDEYIECVKYMASFVKRKAM